MKLELDLLPHQIEFVNDITTRYVGLVGGFGCGKTQSICYKGLVLAIKNLGYKGAIMSPTISMNDRELMPAFEGMLIDLEIPYRVSKSNKRFDIIINKQKAEIYFMSIENHMKARSMNLAWFLMDEIDTVKQEIAEAAWITMISRLRRGRYFQGAVATTPEGFKWTYKFFVEEASADKHLIHAKTTDNIFLPDEYIEDMRNQWSASLIDAYMNGQFVNLTSGSVYPNFDRIRNHTDQTIDDFGINYPLHIGVDFNVYNMTGIINVIDRGMPITIAEITGEKNTESLAKRIRHEYPNRRYYAYPDSSGKSEHSNASATDISQLESNGIQCFYSSKNPPIRDRVNSFNAMLLNMNDEVRYKVNTKKCPMLTKSLEQQSYDDNGKPSKANNIDHPVDAQGYFIWHEYGLKRSRSYVSI